MTMRRRDFSRSQYQGTAGDDLSGSAPRRWAKRSPRPTTNSEQLRSTAASPGRRRANHLRRGAGSVARRRTISQPSGSPRSRLCRGAVEAVVAMTKKKQLPKYTGALAEAIKSKHQTTIAFSTDGGVDEGQTTKALEQEAARILECQAEKLELLLKHYGVDPSDENCWSVWRGISLQITFRECMLCSNRPKKGRPRKGDQVLQVIQVNGRDLLENWYRWSRRSRKNMAKVLRTQSELQWDEIQTVGARLTRRHLKLATTKKRNGRKNFWKYLFSYLIARRR